MSTWYVTAASISPNMSTTCLRVLHGILSDDAMELVMPLDWLQKLDVNEGSLILRWWWAKFVNTHSPFPGCGPTQLFVLLCCSNVVNTYIATHSPFPGCGLVPLIAACCPNAGAVCYDVSTVPFSRTAVSYYPFPRDSFYTCALSQGLLLHLWKDVSAFLMLWILTLRPTVLFQVVD